MNECEHSSAKVHEFQYSANSRIYWVVRCVACSKRGHFGHTAFGAVTNWYNKSHIKYYDDMFYKISEGQDLNKNPNIKECLHDDAVVNMLGNDKFIKLCNNCLIQTPILSSIDEVNLSWENNEILKVDKRLVYNYYLLGDFIRTVFNRVGRISSLWGILKKYNKSKDESSSDLTSSIRRLLKSCRSILLKMGDDNWGGSNLDRRFYYSRFHDYSGAYTITIHKLNNNEL